MYLCLFSQTKRIWKKISTAQKKVAKVGYEFKNGELPAGKSGTIVTYRKQAIAIAQREAKEF